MVFDFLISLIYIFSPKGSGYTIVSGRYFSYIYSAFKASFIISIVYFLLRPRFFLFLLIFVRLWNSWNLSGKPFLSFSPKVKAVSTLFCLSASSLLSSITLISLSGFRFLSEPAVFWDAASDKFSNSSLSPNYSQSS